MILTGDGAVAGVLSSQSKPNIGETLLFTQIHGPDVRRLLALRARVPKPADPPGMAPRRPAHAEEAFRTTLDCWESLMKTELSHASDLARQLVDKRPESMGAHLLLASIELQREKRAADGELMRSSLKKATKIAPTSFLAHAVHGHVLVRMERYKEAVAELEQAASLDPGNVLVRLDQMKALRRTDPSAAESLGRQLVRDASENVSYRVELVESLRVRGKHAEVVKEAREGLKRRPDDLHLLALMGDALEQTGALDEAETCFKRIAEGHSCSKCWFRYARFLVEHRPNRRSEAAKMLDKVESLNSSQVVSAKDIAECRARLAGTTKPAD